MIISGAVKTQVHSANALQVNHQKPCTHIHNVTINSGSQRKKIVFLLKVSPVYSDPHQQLACDIATLSKP